MLDLILILPNLAICILLCQYLASPKSIDCHFLFVKKRTGCLRNPNVNPNVIIAAIIIRIVRQVINQFRSCVSWQILVLHPFDIFHLVRKSKKILKKNYLNYAIGAMNFFKIRLWAKSCTSKLWLKVSCRIKVYCKKSLG